MGENSTTPDRSWFRGDIDGLRAVAIVLVVAFHAGIPGFTGGFIGVDVFFVISGYLITRNLVSEADGSGRVRLATFWAKRAKRLVPAMALMVVVTFIASALVLSPLETASLPLQGGSAILYVSNIVFARADEGYFAETEMVSPFLHTWSLSVEEQFYLLWPVLVLVTFLVLRARRDPRRGLIVLLAAGSVVSMAMNLVATRADSAWAFYSLPTRAWEFGLAGLLAIVTVPAWLRRRGLQIGAVVVGVALLVYGTLNLVDDGSYPGLRALVPVGATLLLIYAGTALGHEPLGSTRALSCAPMQWVGRISYSWYLWHWPFIVLAAAWFDSDAVGVRTAAGLVALPVAAALYTWFERPIRFAPRLAGSPRLALGLAAGISVVALLVAVGFAGLSSSARSEDQYASLLTVRAQHAAYRCPESQTSPSGIELCVDGDVDGARTVLLIGDSHARQWKDAFAQEAADRGIRIIPRWIGACPSLDVTTRSKRTQEGGLCSEYRLETLALIEELQPEAVVVSNAYRYLTDMTSSSGSLLGEDVAVATWFEQYVAQVEAIRAAAPATQIGRIGDNPDLGLDPLACVSRPGNGEADCLVTRDRALETGALLRAAEDRATAQVGGLPTLNTVDRICDDHWCSFEQDGVYVFADSHHLAKEWTKTQSVAIGELFDQLGLTGSG